MLKKTLTLLLLLFLTSCGYQAIHSKKNSINYDFSVSELTFIGERGVNLKIKERLNNYTLNEKDKKFVLIVSSVSEKVILAKDLTGDPTSFKNTVIINVEVLMEGNLKNNLQIIESFNYNNNTNKFDLKKYEKEIKNNLAEAVTDKLIFKLSNIQ
jgi:hypothetical protein|tara:strand:+ start:617 stop:1081 length:465 start_codon:yes stop_codon:yes gene_type:complete